MYIDKLNTGAPEGKRAGHYITFISACQVKFFEKNAQKNSFLVKTAQNRRIEIK